MSKDEGGDNVIEIFGERIAEPPVRVDSHARGCRHLNVEIFIETRELKCRLCGEDVNHFDWLYAISTKWRHAWWKLERARSETSRLAREIEKSKKALRSLEGKIARRKAKIRTLEQSICESK